MKNCIDETKKKQKTKNKFKHILKSEHEPETIQKNTLFFLHPHEKTKKRKKKIK